MRRVRLLLLLLLVPMGAGASSIREEVAFNGAQASQDTPNAGSFSDRLSGNVDLGDRWNLQGALLWTHFFPQPFDATDPTLAVSAANASTFFLGADFMPGPHWDLGLTASLSPRSNQHTVLADVQTFVYRAKTYREVLVGLSSSSSAAGAQANVTYTSAGFSDLEHTVDLGVGFNAGQNKQSIGGFQLRGKEGDLTLTLPEIRLRCELVGCPPALNRLLNTLSTPYASTLGQLSLSLTVLETLFLTTDLSVNGTYFLYSQDPNAIAVASLSRLGQIRQSDLEAGQPIAPLLYLLQFGVDHRLGSSLSLGTSYAYGKFIPGQGESHTLNLRAEIRLTTHWRLAFSATGQLSVDSYGTDILSGGGSVAVRYRF